MYRRGAGKRDPHNKPVKRDVRDSDKHADLLVFGYACKVFRDDERALFHEHGKHLIPWMGDKNIMIDRYDGRGHLHDLSEYDSGSWNTSYQLSEEEARIEMLCDEERYLAMHTDLLEEEARQEEEYKRLSEAVADEGTYNAVAFRYSADYYDPSQPTEEDDGRQEPEEETEESEEPFVAPPGLTIPPDMELPATTKTHAIIERTANFVCQQGAQFEIVLKAKQSGNSQFDFLRFDHYLNPYYKHILRAMKEGRYNLPSDNKQEQSQESQSESDDDGDGSYLHPSLFAPKKSSRLEELMKPLQVMDPDHPLAALVLKARRERNGTAALEAQPAEVEEQPPPAVAAAPTEYTSDPNVTAMYYGYCMLPDGTYCLAPPPPGIDANSYYSTVPTGVMAPPTVPGAVPPPGTTPPPLAEPIAVVAPTAAPTQVTMPAAPAVLPETSSRPPAAVAVAVPSVAAVAAGPAATVIIPPPPDIQPVIDKLAEYVARNGVKFETSVRAKNDPRFDFLQTWNQYNTYYEFKKNYFMQKEGISRPEAVPAGEYGDQLDGEDDSKSKTPAKDTKMKASFAPICFAIKVKENDMLPLERNRVRLDDDSDDDPDKVLEAVEGMEDVLGRADMMDREFFPVPTPEEKRPTLTLEELEAKQAKQKLEDRLALAAREKLAQASKESKEKQLQAERKRKAALFLQNLRTDPVEAKKQELEAFGLPEETRIQPISVYPEFPAAGASATPVHPSTLPPVLSSLQEHRCPPEEQQGAYRSREPPSSSSSSGPTLQPPAASSSMSSSSRDKDKDRDRDRERNRDRDGGRRDKEKKKKKHKKRSRSRSGSRSKNKHSLPSAYRTVRRSRSRSPGRRERRAHSSDRRREERERDRHGPPAPYRPGSNMSVRRGHSRSRSPHEKKKKKRSSSSSTHHTAAVPSLSPSGSPTRGFSPFASPTSDHSRDGSQEKDRHVSSTIVSAVQSKITQDLMAKVRAMLAASKTFNPPTS